MICNEFSNISQTKLVPSVAINDAKKSVLPEAKDAYMCLDADRDDDCSTACLDVINEHYLINYELNNKVIDNHSSGIVLIA